MNTLFAYNSERPQLGGTGAHNTGFDVMRWERHSRVFCCLILSDITQNGTQNGGFYAS